MYGINKKGKTKNVLYEPLMDYIIKKDYNYIWEDKQVKNITNIVVAKSIGRYRSIDINLTKDDLYTDCFMCLVKAVDTYNPFSPNGFMPFLVYYYSTAKYLINKPKCVSTMFCGKREIVTKYENENIRTDREVMLESGNATNAIRETYEDSFSNLYDKELLDAIDTLPNNIRTLITMAMNGERQVDIGKALGVAQTQVCCYLKMLKKFLTSDDPEGLLLKMPNNKLFTKENLRQTIELFDNFGIRKDRVVATTVEENKENKNKKYRDNREINIYKINKTGKTFVGTANNITQAAKMVNGNKYSIFKVLSGELRSSNKHIFRYKDLDYYQEEEKEEEVDIVENKLNIQEQIDKLEQEKEVIQKKIDELVNIKQLQQQIEKLQQQLQEQIEQLAID